MTTQRADVRGLVKALEDLLGSWAGSKGLTILHELKRTDGGSRPFSLQTKDTAVIDAAELLLKADALSAPGEPVVAKGIVTAGYDGPSVVFPASDADDKALCALVGERVYIHATTKNKEDK